LFNKFDHFPVSASDGLLKSTQDLLAAPALHAHKENVIRLWLVTVGRRNAEMRVFLKLHKLQRPMNRRPM